MYFNKDGRLLKNIFNQPIGVVSEVERRLILEKILNICIPHILEEFQSRLEFEGYYKYEYKAEIYGDNYIIYNFYRLARTDNGKTSYKDYKESFHISIKAIINNIAVSSEFWVVWKDIAYSLDAYASNNILELLCIAPYWINTQIYKYR